ncbi:P-loop containing nucleoside triphosphate hydrolase protein [Pavlovales sp. CCMP2436]|nr:P-loop containing nucleoside triphosphate hydrolase protein [Pavlovales sp. CCMP2436]
MCWWARTRSFQSKYMVMNNKTYYQIDVLVGTHSILSKRVAFKDLGLMIVDEEHRFGVNQKEKVKALSVKVDYLTMSATPIPRTLSLGLSALRDMSVLNEPPLGRLPVKTLVDRYSPKLIENAISAELARGGQVFYVVPRIAHVEPALRMLELIFGPDLSTEWAHGQCTDLEERMLRFANGTARVLVSTSVVECGIDMPNVNTLLVQDAHMFGLASLHQLRGRVGRSSVQAYAHLMTNGEARLTPEASSRLRALKEFSALGDGFELAQADMALRGCGNLLGPEQSGQINDMGAEYFFEMLEEAIDNARKLAEKGDAQEADYGANYVPNGSGRS